MAIRLVIIIHFYLIAPKQKTDRYYSFLSLSRTRTHIHIVPASMITTTTTTMMMMVVVIVMTKKTTVFGENQPKLQQHAHMHIIVRLHGYIIFMLLLHEKKVGRSIMNKPRREVFTEVYNADA